MNWIVKMIDSVKKWFLRKEDMVFDKNQHIADYLDYFINDLDSPGFSVLINGEWGIGKTWFINEYLSKINQDESLEIVKISLYGQNSIDEINAEIFQAIHPKKHKFKNGFISKVVSSTAKSSIFGIKLDLIDFMPNGKYAFDENKEYILIFDDLERSHISTPLLMGYLNDFVENQKQKVILIGNESKLLIDKEDENKDPSDEFSYENIKEKLIGKTFSYQSNIELAILSFIENSNISDFYKKNKMEIFKLFKQANYNNLRQIKISLQDFERLYHLLSDKILSDEELLKQLLLIYIALDFEYKNGRITASEINYFPEVLYLNSELEESESKGLVQKAFDKYSCVFLKNVANWILSPEIWKELLVDSFIQAEKINDALESAKNGTEPDWLKLVKLRNLDENSFSSLIAEVNKNIEERKYIELGEIKQIFSVLFFLSNQGIIQISDLIQQSEDYIEYLATEGLLDNKATIYDVWGDDSYGGYSYFDLQSNEFKQLQKFINKQLLSVSSKIQKIKAKELESNPANEMIDTIEDDQLFDHRTLPFLQYVTPNIFVTKTLSQPFNSISGLTTFIKERYRSIHIASYKDLCQEKSFVETCLTLYQTEKSNTERTISRLNSGYFEKAFEEASKLLAKCDGLSVDELP